MIETAQLDGALQELRNTGAATARVNALKLLVEYWHGPMGRSAGYAAHELADLPLPGALRWWYRWAGRRTEITCGQDRILRPEELSVVDDGRLVEFWIENQGVYTRASVPAGDDPMVSRSGGCHEGQWKQEGMSVLGFLMQVCVQEAQSDYRGLLDVEQAKLDAFAAAIPRLPVPPWVEGRDETETWGRTDFHVGEGIFAQTIDLGRSPAGIRGYTVSVAAKDREALHILDTLFDGEEWDERTF